MTLADPIKVCYNTTIKSRKEKGARLLPCGFCAAVGLGSVVHSEPSVVLLLAAGKDRHFIGRGLLREGRRSTTAPAGRRGSSIFAKTVSACAPLGRTILYTGRGFMKNIPSKTNPRSANGALRRRNRARLRAMGCECGICKGRLGPIHYDEPSDAAHPLSFVVDEIKPVSKWRQFGYSSARAAAEDWDNLQAAHYFCNAQKSNKTGDFWLKTGQKLQKAPKISDGSW